MGFVVCVFYMGQSVCFVFSVFGVFSLVRFELSIPVQVIAWIDLSLKWPVMCRAGRKTVLTQSPIHLLNFPFYCRSLYHCNYAHCFLPFCGELVSLYALFCWKVVRRSICTVHSCQHWMQHRLLAVVLYTLAPYMECGEWACYCPKMPQLLCVQIQLLPRLKYQKFYEMRELLTL